ncbi:MAG: 50S ribosomal protein L13 [Bacteroidia bacterium]|nr:MAG: 50S ribosomal protein L13 [Bacteroidia bacterium]
MQSSPKTHFFKPEEVPQRWYLVDAAGQTLGRIASQVAHILRGKHKPQFTPNFDVGDYVVVINAEKVVVTGNREELKQLYHNTLYPGGARFESIRDLLKRRPEYVMEHAVKGMLPHNRLGRKIFRKLKVYAGDKHPHSAQKPEPLPQTVKRSS